MKRLGDILVNVISSLLLTAIMCIPAMILVLAFGWSRTDALLVAILWALATEFVRKDE